MMFSAKAATFFGILLIVILNFNAPNAFSQPTDADEKMVDLGTLDCEPFLNKRVQLVKINPLTKEYQGLTVEGLEALKKAREIFRERETLFRSEIRNLDTVHHAGNIARLFKGNMLLYGPPGGAKSLVVNWLMKGESESPYKLQLHQMISEQAFIGSQNFNAAKEGRFQINTKGSLADYVVALIDETEKGNPAALGSLLSLLNEREILAGNQVIKARLETMFATSNANLPEIFQQFVENGQGSTAPALLNRFQFKAFIYNWLEAADQAILDEREERRNYLTALAETHPEVLKDEVFLQPKQVDWVGLRQMASVLFKSSPLFKTVNREFVNDMRNKTNEAIRSSEEDHKNNHLDTPFVYFPSADYTERLRQKIGEIIRMSVFMDFLISPLADDSSLEQITQKQIEVDPLSLWRGYLVMTTIGPGEAKIKFDPSSDQKFLIDFDWSIDPSKARDKREQKLIENLISEQKRFASTLDTHLTNVSEQIKLRARNSVLGSSPSIGDASFELLMLHYRGQ